MPDQSSADRRPWLCALGHQPGPADRLRHRDGHAACARANARKSPRTTTSPSSNTPRPSRANPDDTDARLGARAREAARVAGARVPRPHARRRRALRRGARRVPARLRAQPERCPRGRGAARHAPEAAHEDRRHAQRQDRARVARSSGRAICRRQDSTCRQTPSSPIRSSSARPAAAMSFVRSPSSRA